MLSWGNDMAMEMVHASSPKPRDHIKIRILQTPWFLESPLSWGIDVADGDRFEEDIWHL